jgi:hypothetical protein
MNKRILLLISVFALLTFVSASSSKILLLKLTYNSGNLTISDTLPKNGFFPDRRFQPDTGYRLDMTSMNGSVLYSFRFNVPNIAYVDSEDEKGELRGGKVILNDFDFGLELPYYRDIKEINIYKPDGSKAASYMPPKNIVENNENGMSNSLLAFIIAIILSILAVFIIIVYKRKAKKRRPAGKKR